MFANLVQRLRKNVWSQVENGIDRMADEIVASLSPEQLVEHKDRIDVETRLPNADTDGAVKICATKDNEPIDGSSPAIALNICCGKFKLGESDPIGSFDEVGRVLWAKATAKWTNASGNDSYVDCNKATDKAGTLLSPAETIRVYLPRAAGKDPNVRLDDVIFYQLDENDVAVANYLDDKIGTVKMWSLASGAVPPGWAIMNGAHGGSGLDSNGRFLSGITSGSVGVSAAVNTGTGNANISGHTGSGTLAHSQSGDLSHAAIGSPTNLSHSPAAGNSLQHQQSAGADLAHAGSGTSLAHAGSGNDAPASGTSVDVDNNVDGTTINVFDFGFGITTDDADVANALDSHSADDVALALVDHTKAEVVACINDHAASEVTDCIEQHEISDIADNLADHTYSVSDHNGTDIAALLGGHSDSGHAHTPGTPPSINLFMIERVD